MADPTRESPRGRAAAGVLSNKLPATRAKPLPKHRPTVTQAATRSRSLLSRSRVSRAVEAARRVGGGLIVAAALNVSGLRAGAGINKDGTHKRSGRHFQRTPIGLKSTGPQISRG